LETSADVTFYPFSLGLFLGIGYSEFEYEWLLQRHREYSLQNQALLDQGKIYWAILKELQDAFFHVQKVVPFHITE